MANGRRLTRMGEQQPGVKDIMEYLEDILSNCCGAPVTEAGEFCSECLEHN